MFRFATLGLWFMSALASVSVAQAEIFTKANDTVAGQSSSVRVAGLLTHEEVGFSLKRPDGTRLAFSGKADDLGVVQLAVAGLHLQRAGDYELSMSRDIAPQSVVIDDFQVLPGTLSAYRSSVELADPSVAADGETESFFIVQLRDAYGNRVADQRAQVVSSRNEDRVIAERVSDQYGELKGKVISDTAGVSVLSVLADDVALFEKPEIVFHLHDSGLRNVGQADIGSFLKAQLFEDADFQELAYFTIEDLPSEVFMDQRYTYRVVAKDEDGNVVPNYRGKVRFASSDDRAQLPFDYEFDAEDQGIHTFALAIVMGTEGVHTLSVNDTQDFRIAGEKEVTVVDASKINKGSEEPGIEILSPRPGMVSSSRITITGKAIGTNYVRLVDGPTVLVEELEVDASGEFVYQTPALADGTHRFRASSLDDSLVSQEVMITVDQSAPTVMALDLDPRRPLEPKEPFFIKVSSNEPLSKARCVVDEILTELDLSGDKFVGNFQAPSACGSYPIGCTIADLLGNELEEPNAEVLKVCGGDGNGEEDPSDAGDFDDGSDGSNGGSTDDIAPTAVTNLSAVGGDERVTLFWSPAKDNTQVANYRVAYGTSEGALNEFNTTPDDRTQWYVDGLVPGTKYFFQVFAMDSAGKTGVGSNIVQATPSGVGYKESAPKPPTTGGNNYWLPLGMAALAGFFFFGFRRKAE